MKIGVDIDGVVADFVTPFLPLLSDVLGRPVAYEDITVYRFQEAFGYSDAVEKRVQEEIDRRELFRHMPVVPGSLAAVRRLAAAHAVHFITARSEAQWGVLTRAWLQRKGFPYASLEFREGRKAEASEGFDVFVEDSLENALDLATQQIHVCLMDHPWNRSSDLPSNCTRVRSWPEVEAVVAALDGKR